MVLPVAIAVASIAMSAYGAISGHGAAKKAAARARAIARKNAAAIREQANETLLMGRQAADKEIVAADAVVGTQRAQIAASGIVVDSGSAADVTEGTRLRAAANSATVTMNAARQARNLRESATLVEAGGAATAAQYDAAGTAALLHGGTSILGTVGNYYGSQRTSTDPRTDGATPAPVPATK